MTPPADLVDEVAAALGGRPDGWRPLGGGDASRAAGCRVGERTYLVKWQRPTPAVPPGWPTPFEAEARGLARLAEAGPLRVPGLIALGRDWIALEWIEAAERTDASAERLGRGLAALHRSGGEEYGLDHDNWCGRAPQRNRPGRSWLAFYGQERLGVQIALAGARGRLPPARAGRLERLVGRLGDWIDDAAARPSLLHGDLWGGNWLATAADEPVLIDPAVYVGDREAELAMCHLFGGFPLGFFAAYDRAWPPAPGRDDRVGLYQLYHLLNHLSLFGEEYGPAVDAVLSRYLD